MRRICDRFAKISQMAKDDSRDPMAALQAFFVGLYFESRNQPDQTRLLIRELLDDKRRSEIAGTWRLQSFLERLIAVIKKHPNWRDANDADALLIGYQLLGAINYFSVAEPTLTGIFGEDRWADLEYEFPNQLERLIHQAFEAHPAAH